LRIVDAVPVFLDRSADGRARMPLSTGSIRIQFQYFFQWFSPQVKSNSTELPPRQSDAPDTPFGLEDLGWRLRLRVVLSE
jgi:hypothetical protein